MADCAFVIIAIKDTFSINMGIGLIRTST